jgi:hypothetical protein
VADDESVKGSDTAAGGKAEEAKPSTDKTLNAHQKASPDDK